MVTEFHEAIILELINSSPSILAAPSDKKKFFSLSKKIRNILGTLDIIELRYLLKKVNYINLDRFLL